MFYACIFNRSIKVQLPCNLANPEIKRIHIHTCKGLLQVRVTNYEIVLTVNGIWGVVAPPVARSFREKYQKIVCV